MPTRKIVRFSAVALIGFACVLATEARADFIPVTLPAAALTAPLTCTAPLGLASLTVTAGFDTLPVPHDVTSATTPSCPTGQTCSEYTYHYVSTGGAISKGWLSLSSDVTIYEASITSPTPSLGSVLVGECLSDETPTNGLTACAQREIRFSPNAATFDAKVVVSRAASRIATVGVFAGFKKSFCLIQGPGVPGGAFTPFTNSASQKLAGGKLDVLITFGPDGKPNGGSCKPVQAPGITCFEGSPVGDLTVNEQVLRDFEIVTFGDGTSTCLKGNPTKCYCTAAPCP